jgi:tetratricopeptide (TPR) repeat protein
LRGEGQGEGDYPEETVIKIKQKTTKQIKDKMQLALKLQQSGNLQQAERIYRDVLNKQPNNAYIYFQLGFISQAQRRFDEAVSCYRKAVHLKPDFVQAYFNLGVVLQEKGNFDDAIACYRKAVQREENPLFYFNLGSAVQEQWNLDEAEDCYKKALALNPDYAKAHNNLGLVLKQKMQLDDAMFHIQKAVALDPDFAEARVNLSGMLLMKGDFQEGWKQFEWRRKMKYYHQRNFHQPYWDGSHISGRTILIYNEQEAKGFGDTIQCVRYIPLVAQLGAKVIIECQKELLPLLQHMEGADTVIAEGELFPHFDVHCSFLSLPAIFHSTIESIPARIPYITAPPALMEKWKHIIRHDHAKMKIGLVWAGEKRHDSLEIRSCPDEFFSLLSPFDDISLYSLQKGESAWHPEHNYERMLLIDYMGGIHDFSDTAALIKNLDLIISVDTAVAHLAGALGSRVWTLLPFMPDARWLLQRDDSPWYPTMRLFRQTSPGDWKTVMERIAREIRRILS